MHNTFSPPRKSPTNYRELTINKNNKMHKTAKIRKQLLVNIKPSRDFMFQLTNAEFEELKRNLIFQNGTLSWVGREYTTEPTLFV